MAQRTVERLSYFSFYVADYLLDTGDLTLAQHGAYCLLIFRYYWQGSVNEHDVYRSCRTDADKHDVDFVLERYFRKEGDRYLHNRIERELEAIGAYVELQSKKGKRSAEVRAGKKSDAPVKETVDIPQWIEAEVFRAWIKIRPSRARTPDAQRAAIAKLDAFRAEGLDANSILSTSLSNGWQGLFRPDEKRSSRRGNGSASTLHGDFGRCKYCARPATRKTNDIPHCEEPRHLDWALSRQ